MAAINPQTVYTKTAKGILEIRNKTVKLPRDVGLVLLLVDGKASVAELLPRSGMSSTQLNNALNTLATDGYIKAVAYEPAPAAGNDDDLDLDFTSPQAIAKLNMEAASRALAETEANKQAQQEARAALDARLRQEAEARARALAEARAQAEGEARAKAEAAARAASEERARAEAEASEASDPAERARAEARARVAAAVAVRAEAEVHVRAEAEERARALADLKKAAEEQAREEAQARTQSEEQAQARAAAAARAREALEAQIQVMAGIREAGAGEPQVGEETLAQLRELEEKTQRAREAAEAIAFAESHLTEKPKIVGEVDMSERARELTARVQAGRRAREDTDRKAREALMSDFDTTLPDTQQPGAWPALQLSSDAKPAARAPQAHPARAAASAAAPEPSMERGTETTDLPRVNIPQDEDAAAEHVPTALERAMAEAAARARAAAEAKPEPTARAAPEPAAKAAPGPAKAAPVTALKADIVEDTPAQARPAVDRTARDVRAGSAEAAQLSRTAASARQRRVEEEARKAAMARRRKQRKRIFSGIAIAFVTLAALGVLWLQFIPLNGYVPGAQQALSERLNQPVTISNLSYVLLPTPRLILEGVAVGKAQGVRVSRVEAHTLPFALFDDPVRLDTVTATGVAIDPAMAATIPAWTGGRSASAVHVNRLRLNDVKMNIPGAELGAFSGEVAFAPNGTMKQAELSNDKVKLELAPQSNGVRASLDARSWRIPFGPPVEFTYLTVNGVLDNAQLTVTEFSGRAAGGAVHGKMTASWAGPITLEGEFTVQNARLEELVRTLTPSFSARGALKANGRYAMQAPSAKDLLATVQIEGTFSATRGELTNIDLLRGIQSTASSAFRGGRTPFDELTGSLRIAGGHYNYRQVQLVSGPLNAAGTVEVAPGGALSGRLTAVVAPRAGVVARSSFVVSGTVKEPILRR